MHVESCQFCARLTTQSELHSPMLQSSQLSTPCLLLQNDHQKLPAAILKPRTSPRQKNRSESRQARSSCAGCLSLLRALPAQRALQKRLRHRCNSQRSLRPRPRSRRLPPHWAVKSTLERDATDQKLRQQLRRDTCRALRPFLLTDLKISNCWPLQSSFDSYCQNCSKIKRAV